jgi:hypothetical protein
MMKQPCFFVQNNWIERTTAPVAEFARQAGIALEDRSSTSAFDPEDCGIDWTQYHPVIPYGSAQFLRKLKQSLLAPFVLHEEEWFAASIWQDKLGEQMLNAEGTTVPAAAVPVMLEEALLHVRPNSEDKAFHAQVFDTSDWAAVVQEGAISPDLLCWVSPVKELLAEWRCWIVGGDLVEVSLYRCMGEKARKQGAPADVLAFVQDVARQWLPAPCVVIDVASTPDGLRVLEFNPIQGSGWYAANPAKVLQPFLDWTCRHFQ